MALKVEMDERQLANYIRRLQHPFPVEPTEADVSTYRERILELVETCVRKKCESEKDELQDTIEHFDSMVRYVAVHRQGVFLDAVKRGDVTWWEGDDAWWSNE
jgi:hypothetical protein